MTEGWKGFPFLTQKGIDIIKAHTEPRIDLGTGFFASYKDYGEDIYRIGYGSKKLGRRAVHYQEKITLKQVEEQLVEDLKEFSNEVAEYVCVPLNKNKKAAVLSYAHHIGLCSFKSCRLLELINRYATKNEIIREWSPYINTLWLSGGDRVVSRRRVELDTYFAADKEIPTFVPHRCETSICLLNMIETYTGAPNQIKALEYLEEQFLKWDPSGRSLRHFFRQWTAKPTGLGSPPRLMNDI